MVRFTLFGIPIEIQPLFWIILGVFGLLWDDPRNAAGLLGVALFVLAGFISILVHELGHALTGKGFGARTGVVLHGFGGFAAFPPESFTRTQNALVIAAGPVVQLALGALGLAALLFLRMPSEYIHDFIFKLTAVSIFWAVLNLIPVIPLDGGQLLATILGPKRVRLSLEISIAAAILAGLGLFLILKAFIFPIFLGMMAFQNWQQLQQFRR